MLGLDRESADFNGGRRSAVIDIGSNTVRLVIYGGARRASTVLWNEKVAARLGRGLASGDAMDQSSIDEALASLERYARLLEDLGITDVQTVATAAPRDAINGPDFLEKVAQIGLRPRLLSGEEEAETSAMGVIGAFPDAQGVVADLGGGSLELVEIGGGECKAAASLPLGTLRIGNLRQKGAPGFRNRIISALDNAGWDRAVNKPIYMVGGTFRSLATYALRGSDSPLDDPHAFELSGKQAAQIAKKVASLSAEELAAANGVTAMRAAVLPDAAALLSILLEELRPNRVIFSSWGLREGLLFKRLDRRARLQDPLLAGVAAFAAPRGGKPDLAARVAGWTAGALPRNGEGSERLRLAATMLALASMQVEPNFRARQAVDWALHKRWINLDASGRAAIAATLSANCNPKSLPEELAGLASKSLLNEAASWGLAIRLFRRLGVNSLASFNRSALVQESGKLVLLLGEGQQMLHNRGVDRDMEHLSGALGLDWNVQVIPATEFVHRRFPLDAVTGKEELPEQV